MIDFLQGSSISYAILVDPVKQEKLDEEPPKVLEHNYSGYGSTAK